jgi:hypothetical protein
LKKGNQQEPFLKGIGRRINNLPPNEDSKLSFDIKFYRFTHPGHLTLYPGVMAAIQLAEEKMGLHNERTSTLIELIAGRQTVLTCLLLAKQLGLPPHEIAQNFTPQEGEQPEEILMRLIEWQMKMMEKIYQQQK